MISIFKKEYQTPIESIINIHELVREGNDYFSDELILLDEKLTGNLFCAEKVVIENQGILFGNITSKTCVVNGVVNGDITSLDLLEIKGSAVVIGNIQSSLVNIEPGAVINGYITVGEHIDALIEEWNKTKFFSDDYLTAKLTGELSALNKSSDAANIIVEQQKQPEPVMAKEQTPARLPVVIPIEPKQALEPKQDKINDQRWW